MARFMVRSKALRALDVGSTSPLGEVTATQPGNEWAVVEIDGTPEEIAARLQHATDTGEIEEWQPEPVYHPLGTITTADENVMGQDLPLVGVTPAWQTAVHGGADVILGITDTGHPTQAAKDAHFPDVQIIGVYGTEDTHGHETFCTSRMVGPRGVLPHCRTVVSAQVLPGGQGTTTQIVQGLRAVAGWRGSQGERVHAINMSLGASYTDPVIDGEVDATEAQGIAVVAAMGNGGWSAPTGSPATAADYCAGATTYDGRAPASFSTGGCNSPRETCAIPGENVGGAHLDGGYGRGSGTSFSAPVLTAIVGAMKAMGWE